MMRGALQDLQLGYGSNAPRLSGGRVFVVLRGAVVEGLRGWEREDIFHWLICLVVVCSLAP